MQQCGLDGFDPELAIQQPKTTQANTLAPAPGLTAEQHTKLLKKLSKKLRDIERLEALRSDGREPEQNQITKISAKDVKEMTSEICIQM